jgi:hypothetical protein
MAAPGVPKVTAQRIAIAFLVLAVFDAIAGQKTLAMVCAGIAIVLSLGASFLKRGGRKNGRGR